MVQVLLLRLGGGIALPVVGGYISLASLVHCHLLDANCSKWAGKVYLKQGGHHRWAPSLANNPMYEEVIRSAAKADPLSYGITAGQRAARVNWVHISQLCKLLFGYLTTHNYRGSPRTLTDAIQQQLPREWWGGAATAQGAPQTPNPVTTTPHHQPQQQLSWEGGPPPAPPAPPIIMTTRWGPVVQEAGPSTAGAPPPPPPPPPPDDQGHQAGWEEEQVFEDSDMEDLGLGMYATSQSDEGDEGWLPAANPVSPEPGAPTDPPSYPGSPSPPPQQEQEHLPQQPPPTLPIIPPPPLDGGGEGSPGMPWDAALALRCLAKSPMPRLNLLGSNSHPLAGGEGGADGLEQQGGEGSDEGVAGPGGVLGGGYYRGRLGLAVPPGSPLETQLDLVCSHYSSPINPTRMGSSLEPSTYRKVRLCTSQYLGYLVRYRSVPPAEATLEQTLSSAQVGDWLQHLLTSRRASPNTCACYISSMSQTLRALRAMSLPGTHRTEFDDGVKALRTVGSQLQSKGGQSTAYKRMMMAVSIRGAMQRGLGEQQASLPTPLRYALVRHHATLAGAAWLAVAEPINTWDQPSPEQLPSLMMMVRELATSAWRCLQAGEALPPLRPSVAASLRLAGAGEGSCSHPTCTVLGCKGNTIGVEEMGAQLVLAHHKAGNAQEGLLAGPLAPTLPAATVTGRLLHLLLGPPQLLAWLHSQRGSHDAWVAEGRPLLWDWWSCLEGGGRPAPLDPGWRPTGRPLPSSSQYAARWVEVAVGPSCLVPRGWGVGLGGTTQLQVEAWPFPLNPPYAPSEARPLFATTMMSFKGAIQADLERADALSPVIKDIMARYLGHRSETMCSTYDRLLRAEEQGACERVMASMDKQLQALLKAAKWTTCTRQRLRLQQAQIQISTTTPAHSPASGGAAAAAAGHSGGGAAVHQAAGRTGGWWSWLTGRKRARGQQQ